MEVTMSTISLDSGLLKVSLFARLYLEEANLELITINYSYSEIRVTRFKHHPYLGNAKKCFKMYPYHCNYLLMTLKIGSSFLIEAQRCYFIPKEINL